MTIVGQTDANTPIGTIVDTATVTSQETDPTPADESVAINTTVVTSADLQVAAFRWRKLGSGGVEFDLHDHRDQ